MKKSTKFFFVLLLTSFFLASFFPVRGNITVARINDSNSQEIAQFGQAELPKNTFLAIGDDFSTAIEIPMSIKNGIRTGSKSFQLNGTVSSLFFRYNINDTSPVLVTINSASGYNVDESKYEVAYDVYQGPGYDYWVDYKSTNDFDLPMQTDYPAKFTGDHFIFIQANDIFDYQFDPNEYVMLNITIQHFPPGSIRENEKTTNFKSDPINVILTTQKYLQDKNYLNFQSLSASLKNFTAANAGFAKTIGLSIYGLLKSAEVLSKLNQASEESFAENMTKYIELAYSLYQLAKSTMLEPTNQLFFFRPSESNVTGQDYVTYLSDNLYMIMGMNEIIWFTQSKGLDNRVSFDVNSLLDSKILIVNRMIAMFQVGNGDFRESISIVDYSEDANIDVFDANDYASISYSNINSLESYALLAETLFWEGNYTIMDDVVSRIVSNFNITSVNGVNILPSGIFASEYNVTSGKASQIVDLLGNSFLVSHLNTYAKENYHSPSLKLSPTQVLDLTGNLMQNILRVFSVDAGSSSLLYSKVNVSDINASEKTIINIDNVAAIFAINRLSVNWEIRRPDEIEIARSWKIRSLNGINDLHELFFDEQGGFYFGYWDDLSNKFDVDDKTLEKNVFLANTFIDAVLIDMFPIEALVIEQPNLKVGSEGQLTLGLNFLDSQGTWIWWDPFKPFSFDIKITIPEFGYVATEKVRLEQFSQGTQVYIPFLYEIQKRGEYHPSIELSTEGIVLLSQTTTIRALGEARVEGTLQRFSITDKTFETDIGFVDENGKALDSLQVKGSLGADFENSKAFGNKYLQIGRTDSSGKLNLRFIVSQMVQDNIINLTEIYNEDPIPQFVEIPLFLNITNAKAFDLESVILVIPVQVMLNQIKLSVSPSILEITQGTTESYTFSVNAFDKDQNPIQNAEISYRILELKGIQNKVFTDADGEASITLRDTDLVLLNNYALFSNQGRDNTALRSVNVTVELTVKSSLYPTKIIHRPLTILPNSLVIIANPVQMRVKEANIVNNEIPPIEIEVAVNDLFSRTVNAFVSLEWSDPSINDIVFIDPTEKHISPYTFSLDISKLSAGNYTFFVIAEKDGITNSVQINATKPKIGLSQISEIHKPVVIARTIVIESATIEDLAISMVGVLSALIFAKAYSFGYETFLRIIKIKRKCPYCDELISSKIPVCSSCGRDVNPKQKNEKKTDLEGEKKLDNDLTDNQNL